jgi:RNA polymerase sigma-70 factor, ECF subfamily
VAPAPRSPHPGRAANGAKPVVVDAAIAADAPEAEAPPLQAEESPAVLNRAAPAASNLERPDREQRAREAQEDRALIAEAQSGSKAAQEAAFRKLVLRHQRRAFAIAFGFLRDENDAREVVQEAFLRVYKGLATFEGQSSFFTWLYRIVTNLSIDLMRKPGRKATELDENRPEDPEGELALVSRVDGADPVDVMRRKEIANRIQTALEALPPYHRAVILMREVEGLSYEEMAAAMDVSKGTIMSRLFHARQKMQRALADCYAEQGYRASASADEEELP